MMLMFLVYTLIFHGPVNLHISKEYVEFCYLFKVQNQRYKIVRIETNLMSLCGCHIETSLERCA